MATIHTGTRAYAFSCVYNSNNWIDDPTNLISALESELSGISNFSYSRLIISNKRNASEKFIEIEIDAITYQTKTKLNVSETDSLITDLSGALDNVANLVYGDLNVVQDVFSEDPTTSWPGQSMEEE